MLLAIETSCDETAVAILEWDEGCIQTGVPRVLVELVSSQVKLHEPYGGVVPELAAREHVQNLPLLYEQVMAAARIGLSDLKLIAVTQGPGLKGCLLVGLCFAKALAYGSRLPLALINHLEGHLFAFQLMEEAKDVQYPLLALVVSGGHSLLILVKGFRDYQLVAVTRDDAAGEAFDKTATLLGLPYPGGPALSKAAVNGNRLAFSFPKSMERDSQSFSFSGFKTAVLREVQHLGDKLSDPEILRNLAASIEYSIVDTLIAKTDLAIAKFAPKAIVLTGGVAANGYLRERYQELAREKGIGCVIPPHKWCTDNAAMIGAVGFLEYRSRRAEYDQWSSKGLDVLSKAVQDSEPAQLCAPLGLARTSQTTPSRAGQESVKCESAQILSGEGVLKHSEVDKIEQIRSLPAIDSRSRNEFEKCGLGPSASVESGAFSRSPVDFFALGKV